jgi:2-methylcitrate dehydratase
MSAIVTGLPLSLGWTSNSRHFLRIPTTPDTAIASWKREPIEDIDTAAMTADRYVADDLAEFVLAASPADMPGDVPTLMRRNILDSVACAIAALDGDVLGAVRDQIEATASAPSASMIGGGQTSVAQAALFNSVAVRYVDQLDTYLTPGGLCHPADNFGALLAVAESVGATGSEFVLSLAVAYEVQCRFSASVPVMAHGLNHALQLALSIAAGAAKLMRLSAEQTANAMAIAVADNVSLSAVHSEPVSNWKGVSPGITAQRAVYTTTLAQRGLTGPRAIFEGPNGLERLFGQHIDLRLDDPTLAVVRETHLKKYCALIHGQAPIETALRLAEEHNIDYREIKSIELESFQTAYDIAGGGSFGRKEAPQTKEQADYNLKYLLAAAFIDKQVGPEQLQTQRIRRADVQELLRRVAVRPSAAMTSAYPQTTPARVRVILRDGHSLTREQQDFEGAPTRPLTWSRTTEKFHWLTEQYADDDLRDAIVHTVSRLGDEPVSTLTALLTKVSRRPRLPKSRQAI